MVFTVVPSQESFDLFNGLLRQSQIDRFGFEVFMGWFASHALFLRLVTRLMLASGYVKARCTRFGGLTSRRGPGRIERRRMAEGLPPLLRHRHTLRVRPAPLECLRSRPPSPCHRVWSVRCR